MEQTTVNKVTDLCKKQSTLYSDLANLNNEDVKFTIGYDVSGVIYGIFKFQSLSKSFLAEIKELTEKHIKEQIEEVNKELKNL